jgi:hypothetical protein
MRIVTPFGMSPENHPAPNVSLAVTKAILGYHDTLDRSQL